MKPNIIVLDLETRVSATDCYYCGHPALIHTDEGTCLPHSQGLAPAAPMTAYTPIGWGDQARLGLSVGCYYDSQDQRIYWFDQDTLIDTMRQLVQWAPLMVSFNGLRFDFPLMQALVRQRAAALAPAAAQPFQQLGDEFQALATRGYDLLQRIWDHEPPSVRPKGLNTLDALSQANGLGAKLSSGGVAPAAWAAGHWADVLNYCQDDVYKTKALFELVQAGQPLRRADGSTVLLPRP